MAADIGGTGEFDVVLRLQNVNAVESCNEALLLNGRVVSPGSRKLECTTNGIIDLGGDLGIGGGQNKIVNLSEQEDGDTFFARHIDVALMSGGLETEIGEDLGDVIFP
jgi:hypothetical protein